MKHDRNGQAKILTDSEIEAIFSLLNPRDRAVFAVCLYTGCRISEVLSIRKSDILNCFKIRGYGKSITSHIP